MSNHGLKTRIRVFVGGFKMFKVSVQKLVRIFMDFCFVKSLLHLTHPAVMSLRTCSTIPSYRSIGVTVEIGIILLDDCFYVNFWFKSARRT